MISMGPKPSTEQLQEDIQDLIRCEESEQETEQTEEEPEQPEEENE